MLIILLYKITCKYADMIKKLNSCLEYISIIYDLVIEYRCLCQNKNYQKYFDENFKGNCYYMQIF